MENKESPLLNVLNETFDKSTTSQIENNYLKDLKSVSNACIQRAVSRKRRCSPPERLWGFSTFAPV
jgi:hypothetical protein